jgi:isopenicillin N synthase-like dioxygenase
VAQLSAELPLVDLDRPSADADLRRGLLVTGFFLLRDHVVPRRLLDDVRRTTLEFLARSDRDKEPFRRPMRGWAPERSESASAGYGDGDASVMDLCQKYSMGPVVSAAARAADPDYFDDPRAESYFAPNVFPDDAMRSCWEEYYGHMEGLSARLLDRVRGLLGLRAGAWDSMTSSPVSVLRFLSYPDHAGGIRMGAHYDDTLLTIFHQSVPASRFAALEVALPGDTQWRSVLPSDGVFVVNVGEALTYLSGGCVRATKHRVVGAPADRALGSARTSLAHFHLPNWNARLRPARVEGMDSSLGRQSTRFNYAELLEPDGSVLFYEGNQRAVGKLRGATV